MIGDYIILSGVVVIVIGSIFGILEKRFLVKLHKVSAADFVGFSLVLFGMVINGFEPIKSLLILFFLSIWSPSITHTIAKTYVGRMKK